MTISSDKEIEKFQKVSARNRKQGDDYEEYIRIRLRLKRQRGSGCGKIEKEDHVGKDPRGKNIMVQTKSFSGKTITIKIDDLERLVKHAAECKVYEDGECVAACREPVFIVGIVGQMFAGSRDWVLIPLEEWEK